MPNWCQNTLSIKGTKEQIVDFNKKYLPNEAFSFENIIPSPQTIEECPEEYIIHNEKEANRHLLYWDPTHPKNWFNWYDWNCNYWGCKWNATTISVEQNEDSIKIFFFGTRTTDLYETEDYDKAQGFFSELVNIYEIGRTAKEG